MKNFTIRFLMAGVLLISLIPACKNKVQAAVSHADLNRSNFIYLNEERLGKVKDFVEKKDTFFTEAYNQLIVEADEALGKTQIDPGEDYHQRCDLSRLNGDGSKKLPVSATFIIDTNQKIVAGHVEPDYTQRMSSSEIIDALEKLTKKF